MKLSELLKVIPKHYKIGLTDFDKGTGLIGYGTKEKAIMAFAKIKTSTKEQIENMDVVAIRPCTYVQGATIQLFDRDVAPFEGKSGIIIIIEIEG